MFKIKNKETLIVICFFIAVSIISTYPLIFHMDGFLDISLKNGATVTQNPSFDGREYGARLESARENFFRGERWFSVSDFEMPVSYLIFGILVMSIFKVSTVFAHNLMFLISIILSCFGMYLLAYRFTKNHYASIFAGYLYGTSNYLFNEYFWSHGNQMQLQWIPLIFLFLDKILIDKENKLWNSVFLGVFLGIQVLSGTQLTVYLSLLIPVYSITRLYFCDKLFDKKVLNKITYLLCAGLVGIIISGFFIIERLSITSTTRSLEENTKSYWVLDSINQLVCSNKPLSLGFMPFFFSFIAGYLILIKKKKDYYPFLILFFAALLLAFGPITQYHPYYWFYKLWPFVDKFRTPYRMFPFVLLSSCLINAVMYNFIKEKFKIKKEPLLFIGMMLLVILTYKIFSKYLMEHFITYL